MTSSVGGDTPAPSRRHLAWDDHLVTDDVAPVDAVSVIVVREAVDAPGGPEVLLLGRHRAADFAGGAVVFPGGKMDEQDRDLPPERLRGANLHRWAQLLGARDPDHARGLLVAGIRETFEEAGVLLARRVDGRPVDASDLARPAFVDARQRLARRGVPWDWRPWLEREGLVLDLGAVAMWSWWVTPRGRPKRFDTRFLIAHLPEDQQASHDRVENTSLRWSRPSVALAALERGEVDMMYPTRCNLEALDAYVSARAAVQAARADRVDRRRIEPTLRDVGGRLVVEHPHRDPVR